MIMSCGKSYEKMPKWRISRQTYFRLSDWKKPLCENEISAET